ncbi:energy transducer TonB [Sphingomonas sp. NFR15]|uniref:energy transducer TonB family protein n=1 Tax=Sphingomonas sp. NFR15 TaxID=1566282 RepID=UPI00088E831F|nr:energy transducer TonB [Sphingomonas sp. NFR15]SDA36569.1 TonB family C-terminal domain-containing protein [Sphingomonas sp. NFR15]
MKINTLFLAGTIALAALVPGSSAVGRTAAAATESPTLAAWSDRVYRAVEEHLTYPHDVFGRYSTGVVAVKFRCSETGAPADVELYKSSRAPDLDQAALRAVRRIATLHPLPDGMPHNQRIVMRVLFADTPETAAQEIRHMRIEAAQANAWFGRSAPAVASTVALAPPAGS